MLKKLAPTKINLPIFETTEIFRESAEDVFNHFGMDSKKTTIETFNNIGQLRNDSTRTGFFSFRNENLFFWVLVKATHRTNPPALEMIRLEFESQVKKDHSPIFLAFAETVSVGTNLDLEYVPKLTEICFEFDEEVTAQCEKLIEFLKNKLHPLNELPEINSIASNKNAFENVTEKLSFPQIYQTAGFENSEY